MKVNIFSHENGETNWFKWSGSDAISNNFTVSVGGTIPIPQTGGAVAINRELNIDLKEIFNFKGE